MNKLVKAARILDGIFLVFFWIFVLFGGFALLIVGLSCFLLSIFKITTWQNVGSTSEFISFFMPLKLVITNGQIMEWQVLASLLTIFAVLLLLLPPIIIQLIQIRKILKPIKKGRPFDSSVIKNLKNLGWLFVLECLLENAGQFFIRKIPFWFMTIQSIPGETMEVITMNPYSVGGLTTALILFLAAFIIEYGTSLQTQIDETL